MKNVYLVTIFSIFFICNCTHNKSGLMCCSKTLEVFDKKYGESYSKAIYQRWEPNKYQIDSARVAVRAYFYSCLGIPDSIEKVMAVIADGIIFENMKIINLEYFDTIVFSDWQHIEVQGGFPSHFLIGVNLNTLSVEICQGSEY